MSDDPKSPKPRHSSKKSDDPWFRRRVGGAPVFLWILIGVLAVGALGYFLLFSGGEDKPEPRRATPAQSKTPTPPTPQTPQPAVPPGGGAPGGMAPDGTPLEGGSPGDSPTDPEAPPEIPPLPEDVSQWKAPDYYRAKAEGDRKLIDAVTHLGEVFKDTPNAASAAGLLTNLLKKTQPDSLGSNATAGRGMARVDKSLLEGLIGALVTNGSVEARQTLWWLVRGRLATDDGPTSAELALEAIADDPSPANQEFMYHAITDPARLLQGGSETFDAETLREKAFSLIAPTASEGFRLRLVELLAKPSPTPAHEELLRDYLLAQHPENVAAQLLWHDRGLLDEESTATLIDYFTYFSSQSLQTVLNLPESDPSSGRSQPRRSTTYSHRSPRGMEPMSFDPDLPYRLASHLWGSAEAGPTALIERFETEFKQAESLGAVAPLVVFSTTVPTDAARQAVYRLLSKRWKEGPMSLEQFGMGQEVFSDPALLILLKSMPRQAPLQTRTGGGAYRPPPRPRAGAGGNAPVLDQRQAEEAWMNASETILRQLVSRFHEAGKSEQEAYERMGRPVDLNRTDPASEMPIDMHRNATLTCRYHFDWPEGLVENEKLEGVALDEMKIDYVRIEEEASPIALLGHYRRAISQAEIRPTADGIWIDRCRTIPKTEWKLSIDVLITSEASTIDERTREETPLVVEILCIQSRDPGYVPEQ